MTYSLALLTSENLLEDNLSLYREALRTLRIALTTAAAVRQDAFGEGIEAARTVVARLIEQVVTPAPV